MTVSLQQRTNCVGGDELCRCPGLLSPRFGNMDIFKFVTSVGGATIVVTRSERQKYLPTPLSKWK